MNSVIGGFVGDCNLATTTISEVKNIITGSTYSDNNIGGIVGTNYTKLSMSNIVTLF